MRLRMAEEEKQRKMKEFDAQAAQAKTGVGASEEALRMRHAKAEEEKQKKLDQFKEVGKSMSSAYNVGQL